MTDQTQIIGQSKGRLELRGKWTVEFFSGNVPYTKCGRFSYRDNSELAASGSCLNGPELGVTGVGWNDLGTAS